MYQDSGCSSSSSRRGSTSATAAAAAAPGAATAGAATATGTSSSDEETLETLTIITTTITETEITAAATTATATATSTTTTVIATSTATAATAATSTVATSDIDDSSLAESESEECEYIEIDCQTAQGSSGNCSTSSGSGKGNAVLQRGNQQQLQHPHSHQQQSATTLGADVRLLRKIGYIASRVRGLSKFYGDFHLVNPYSARRQRRQLQDILLKHSIFDPGKERERAVLLAAAAVAVGAAVQAAPLPGNSSSSSIEAASSHSHSRSRSRSSDLEEEEEPEEESPNEDPLEQPDDTEAATIPAGASGAAATATTTTTTTTTTTVRRKSSSSSTLSGAAATVSGSVSISASASQSFASTSTPINLLEELLIQFYEDQDQHRCKLTVIRHQRVCNSPDTTNNNCNNIYNNNNNNNNNNTTTTTGLALTMSTSMSNMPVTSPDNQQQQQLPGSSTSQVPGAATSTASYLQPTSLPDDSENPRRRRASDCSAVQAAQAALSNQLHCITLKNNNCATATGKLPFHRGSCGAAGEHLLAANSIANRATIILSKSCSNVDGGGTGMGMGIGVGVGVGVGVTNQMRSSATNIESNTLNGAQDAMATIAAAAASNNGNGNNEYSILQLNNTIIQCHFNDDDFRALVKDLKRKVEYTERMNWLCLSKRPLGPPHRKSSLPKHQEVKRRFLEICDTNFSDEVKAALRLPAFDSYEWGDADVIHLMQTMFIELGFIEKFSIPAETLREWLYEVYKHYNEVPFHNFRHCFCVAQMMYAITRQANLLSRLGDLECLILLVSCICHDLDHPGYNNIYQINARTELALRYNDISPLENHHCSIAFRLLEHPECNIFKNFSRDTFNTIREGIIRCILATDMARHNEILTQFMEITPIFDYSNRAHINLLCMILIKVADISNEARPMDVAEPWLDRLLQEFFAQSAAEKSEGLPVTPFMDPDKVSKPGSQVRFIGLVLLPLFEALGELVPELTELIIIPVRIALEYYRRLNDAQTKTRKSVADSNTSDSNSGTMDSNAAMVSTPGASGDKMIIDKGHGSTQGGGAGGTTGSISPQMPRSGSGISVKSRRSIPSQKSASRTSVDEPGGMAAELHDLPEGSESGDSETATEVDVAEKTSKFKVDTEGSSNRSKSSHSNSRKSSREKRPSMIGELCSSGGGQRIRNSYGNIHGYHTNRCHFGNNRAVSLDQYSSGHSRRLSDGLPQVISDSNVFYGRHHQRSGPESAGATATQRGQEDTNANTSAGAGARAGSNIQLNELLARTEADSDADGEISAAEILASAAATSSPASVPLLADVAASASSNGNVSPSGQQLEQIGLASNGGSSSRATPSASQAGVTAVSSVVAMAGGALGGAGGSSGNSGSGSGSWKSRLRQFSDYFSFSFDKGNKRFGSTRSSPCHGRANNNGTGPALSTGDSNIALDAARGGGSGLEAGSGSGTSGGKPPSICCTISNSQQATSGGAGAVGGGTMHRHRAYSLDVPCSRDQGITRHSSNDSSRQSSRHDDSNNMLHSAGGGAGEVPGIRIASVDGVVVIPPSLNVELELGLASASSSEVVPKI
ncbi:high affinity cGMP-specific 3',5'-cyclic phosphodiesterase 9A [Drosophila persimilis]|uniref:high affinity cGMP-specific 3',5'-cyclic phosphodiesterase 9A n=1 Tax=Drosophila persimilis TaxID=7234 RepID=UPI000F08DE61|nr:high affinity cGMP-specific 3',5'-cyclic phosphodiesterase 9A [Drosophila persimilis]